MAKPLHGSYHVKPVASALREARDLVTSVRDYFRLEAQAMCLVDYPNVDGVGPISEIDKSLRIFRFDITGTISGHNNLRLVFWPAVALIDGDRANDEGVVLPRLWILRVYQKKKQGYGPIDVVNTKARRAAVIKRAYAGITNP